MTSQRLGNVQSTHVCTALRVHCRNMRLMRCAASKASGTTSAAEQLTCYAVCPSTAIALAAPGWAPTQYAEQSQLQNDSFSR